MLWLVITSMLIIVLLVGTWTLTRSRHEQQQDGQRSGLTACGVWIVYLVYTGATIVAAIWIEYGSWPMPLSAGWMVGGALLLFGVGLCAWGMASFRSFSRISGTATDQLVTGGAYQYSRNPQNTGWGIALVGIAIAGHSGAALMLAAGFWLAFAMYLRHEERFLRHAFGKQYEDFCRTTARFLGPPRRS
jgi:protein-S-isoprenylcysteine O-methyltransferase Ste14